MGVLYKTKPAIQFTSAKAAWVNAKHKTKDGL